MARTAPAIAAALVLAGTANAIALDTTDAHGHAIHFADVPDSAAAATLTSLLSGFIHGNEISKVRIWVVPPSALASICGGGAGGCYSTTSPGGDNRITVPTGTQTATVLVHEYGHHIEQSRRTSFNGIGTGIPRWWAARGILDLISSGQLSASYTLGWTRSVPEIFAEDYSVANISKPWWIPTVAGPSAEILAALRQDLTAGSPTPPVVTVPPPQTTPPQTRPPASTTPPSGTVIVTPVTSSPSTTNPAPTQSPVTQVRTTPPEIFPTVPSAVRVPAPAPVLGTLSARRAGHLSRGRRTAIAFQTVPAGGIVVGIRLSGSNNAGASADVMCGGQRIAGGTGAVGRPISFRVATTRAARCSLVLRGADAPVGFKVALRVTPPAQAS